MLKHIVRLAMGMSLVSLCGCAADAGKSTDAGKGQRWITLFDGKTLNGWVPKVAGYPVGEDPLQTFRVKDGTIVVDYDKYGGKLDGRFGHLFYKDPFKAYHLSLDYRFMGEELANGIRTAVNSGVMFDSESPQQMTLEQGYPISVEGQLLGPNPGGPPRVTGSFCTMGTKTFRDGKLLDHCVATDVVPPPQGTWVHYELEVTPDGHVSESVDGKAVVAVDRVELDPTFTRFPIKHVIDAAGGKLVLNGGYIALQSEGHPIEFRNIRIMPLE
jgi:hypothetical protein